VEKPLKKIDHLLDRRMQMTIILKWVLKIIRRKAWDWIYMINDTDKQEDCCEQGNELCVSIIKRIS
jgi:hypothetical protein